MRDMSTAPLSGSLSVRHHQGAQEFCPQETLPAPSPPGCSVTLRPARPLVPTCFRDLPPRGGHVCLSLHRQWTPGRPQTDGHNPEPHRPSLGGLLPQGAGCCVSAPPRCLVGPSCCPGVRTRAGVVGRVSDPKHVTPATQCLPAHLEGAWAPAGALLTAPGAGPLQPPWLPRCPSPSDRPLATGRLRGPPALPPLHLCPQVPPACSRQHGCHWRCLQDGPQGAVGVEATPRGRWPELTVTTVAQGTAQLLAARPPGCVSQ